MPYTARATISEVAQVLQHLPMLARPGWPGSAWMWEERFGAAVSVLDANQTDAARTALVEALPDVFDHVRVGDAPAAVRAVVSRTGGVRSGQMVFCGQESNGVIPFALWWPWGNGTTVSVRIGVRDAAGESA